MNTGFRDWAAARLSEASVNSYMSGLRALELAYGDLDAAHAADRFAQMFAQLDYSRQDERSGRPNPSRVAIDRNLSKTLANLRSHLRFYQSFVEDAGVGEDPALPCDPVSDLPTGHAFSLERDLQRALRGAITQLERGLRVTDGGVEHSVPSGRIDILAEDASGQVVVIELKAQTATRESVAQVLAYMGDLAQTQGTPPRGFLVAPDFDPRALSAARMVPSLHLRRYGFSFTFSDAI